MVVPLGLLGELFVLLPLPILIGGMWFYYGVGIVSVLAYGAVTFWNEQRRRGKSHPRAIREDALVTKFQTYGNRALPIWWCYPLLLLGILFILVVPFTIAFGVAWLIWFAGLIVAWILGFWVRRTYQRTGLPPALLMVTTPGAEGAPGAWPSAVPRGVRSGSDADVVQYTYAVHNVGKAPLTALSLWHADLNGNIVSTVAGATLVLRPNGPPVQVEVEVRGEHVHGQPGHRLCLGWTDEDGMHANDTEYQPPPSGLDDRPRLWV